MGGLSRKQLRDRIAGDEQLETVLRVLAGSSTSMEARAVGDAAGQGLATARTVLDELVDIGAVGSKPRSSGIIFAASDAGRDSLELLDEALANGPLRSRAIQRGVLEAACMSAGASAGMLIAAWPGRRLEQPPTGQEISDAGRVLEGRRYVKLERSLTGAWGHIFATPEGQAALHDLADPLVDPVPTMNIDNSQQTWNIDQSHMSNSGAQSFGAGSTAAATFITPDVLSRINSELDQLETLIVDLPAEAQRPAADAIETARSGAAREAPRPGLIRSGLTALAVAAGAAVGSPAGQGIVTLSEELIELL